MRRFPLFVSLIVVAMALLVWQISRLAPPQHPLPNGKTPSQLVLFCAAGVRGPIETIVQDYQAKYQVQVDVQYGGSNTLLSQMEVSHTGDLFLAADESYIELARSKNLIAEEFPLAQQQLCLIVSPGNPRNIVGLKDLLRDDIKSALGNPDQAAVGKLTRQYLSPSGMWNLLQDHVTRTGVFHPTVPEIANDVKIGSVDAGIVWDSTAKLVTGVEVVSIPELSQATSRVVLAIAQSSQHPTEALRFARYVAARDRGLEQFAKMGFTPVEGDSWHERPELTFFCGTVNRRVVEPVIRQFAEREGIEINTVYNGCGILNAQMKSIRQQSSERGFPDTYLACDRYYLNTVHDWFQDEVELSDTAIVIAVPAGNPKQIRSLSDLTQPGLRVTMGQPDQCTIGVLTRGLLEQAGIWDAIQPNIVQQTATSALLIPSITTGAADATLAYVSDTLSERHRLDVIPLDTPAALAVQPFAISRSSQHKQLARRLLAALRSVPEAYEKAGFHFRAASLPATSAVEPLNLTEGQQP